MKKWHSRFDESRHKMNINFEEMRLMNTRMGRSKLMNTCFVESELMNTDFRGTNWRNVEIDKDALFSMLVEVSNGESQQEKETKARICVNLLLGEA